MKKLIVVALLFGATYTGTALADSHEISANVTLATDYRFRGISQTNRDPAIQGGFDYAHETGAYLGTWASNVSFTDGGTETDFYGGWAGDLTDDVSVDLGFLYYGYPSDSDADYFEIYGSVGFYGATVGVNYSPEYTYDTGTYWYLYGQYSIPVGERISVDLHLAVNQFKSDNLASFLGVDTELSGSPGKSYVDYGISATATVAGVDVTLAFIGTDIDKDDCFPSYTEEGEPSGTKDCKGNAVLSVSKSF